MRGGPTATKKADVRQLVVKVGSEDEAMTVVRLPSWTACTMPLVEKRSCCAGGSGY